MCDYESITRNIRVLSDLHLEHYTILPNFEDMITSNKNDILCLLGDIGNPFQESYKLFLEWCHNNFGIVLLITGNHEYYGNSIESTNTQIEKICRNIGIIFLNNTTYIYKNIAFIGTTLWSYIPEHLSEQISNYMNDYHLIQNFTIEINNKYFLENINFLEKSISYFKNNNFKVVILSHHTPLINSGTSYPPLEEKFQNCAFSSDLSYLVKQVDLWMYGHTHYNNNNNLIWKNNIPLVSNQRGYASKLIKNYNKDFLITINY